MRFEGEDYGEGAEEIADESWDKLDSVEIAESPLVVDEDNGDRMDYND